ncbi:TRAP transporter permease [Azorhizobium doebereinerae]|uniref:TRAP transporter permease n=1 Tax=Azorhizobium doebereinerae TaxID=281091 RepID=UPI0003FA8554
MSAPSLSAETDITPPQTFAPIDDMEHGLPPGFGSGFKGTLLFSIAILFSVYQLFVSTYAILPSQVIRALHVGFLCLISAALIANHRSASKAGVALGWALGLIGFGTGLYQWIFYNDLILRAGEISRADFVVGIALIVVVFAISWQMMGAALPLICGAFLLYGLLGQYLPAPLDHRGYSLEQIVEQMSFGTEGIYGTPIAVSATYIFLFVLFGTFLERAGMIQLFNDIALGLFGRARGGPAKVAVFSSALMGTISGSGVANVVTVGQFTIPLMKRFGYSSSFAGGVEATASMGGQIMPPVMGAVAFIMAETIGVPYATIVKAAIIPAILYFASAFWMVHLEAGKHGLVGIPRDKLPHVLSALRRGWYLLLPLAVLVYLLFAGYTPLFAGAVGLALTVVLILGQSLAGSARNPMLRLAFWIAIGLACSAFFKLGVMVVVGLVAALILANFATRGGRATLVLCRDGLAEGARQALPVGMACAIVGTVIGVLTLTGTATIFGGWVVSIGKDTLWLSLLLTIVTSIILGTGIPTIPTYIITASLAAPALLTLGVPLIVSHMFVFYYGIIADLTPPVALAALAAAPIAKASPDAIGWQACRIALAGFLIPVMAVYEPTLMLQEGGAIAAQYGYWVEVAYVSLKACIVIGLLGAIAIGWLFGPLGIVERVVAALAAFLFVAAMPMSDISGFALLAVFLGWHLLQVRRTPAPAP